MNRTVIAVLGGVVAVVAAGALAFSLLGDDDNANGGTPVSSASELEGVWTVTNATSAPAPVVGTVRLTFEDGRVVAETGCNTANGPYTVEDSTLVADQLASTRMACEEAFMTQEQWILEMLSDTPRLELSGPQLAMHWGADETYWLGLEQEGDLAP
jgi:heat shock protein HslJ